MRPIAQAVQNFETADVRQLDVEHDQIGAGALDQRDRLVAGGRFADDLDIGMPLEKANDARAGGRFILDDHGADQAFASFYLRLMHRSFAAGPETTISSGHGYLSTHFGGRLSISDEWREAAIER